MPPPLKPCPKSPNCVSTLAERASQRMAPLRFSCTVSEAIDAVREAVRACGGLIVDDDEVYLHAEFTTRFFRFVDDVELVIDTDGGRVDFRSASRVGHCDLGANRRRMRKITAHLERQTDFFRVEAER